MLDDLLDGEAGVITARQAIARRVRSGTWQRLHARVYAAFSGPVPRSALRWAAVLYAGKGAALSHETAAELSGLTDEPPALIHVTVPSTRRVVAPPGVVVHHSRRLAQLVHPTRLTPRTRVEELDGRAAHPHEYRWRDRRRDNASAVQLRDPEGF